MSSGDGNKREKWKKNIDFAFGVAGGSVGLANVWRFPYLCYKNGGGAFLISYFILLIGSALPIFFLEASLGQFMSRGATKAWDIVPLMKGIGYASTVLIFNVNTYYMTVLAWTLRYLVASFSTTLPWASCDHDYSTENCYVLKKITNDSNWSGRNNSSYRDLNETANFADITKVNTSIPVSSVVEYWDKGVLDRSSGVHEVGAVNLELLACLGVGWIIVYFCIWKGIGWTSKIVYFTATFPLIMLLVLFVRGITLPGASLGIEYYLKPNISKLQDPQVWTDAATQLFFSYSLCSGIIIALGSYNNYYHNTYRDSILLAFLNSGTSIFSGFAVFSVLGYMAKEQNMPIEDVAESGPGLVFIAYPKAISMLPLPNLWGVLFFLMLFFLGLDSQFVGQESFIASIIDMKPGLFQKPWRREIMIGILCFIQFLFGIFMITQGGVYVFYMYDNYAAAGWSVFFIGICECITISWLFGYDRFWNVIKDMLRYTPRIPWFKYAWAYVAPTLTTAVLIYSLVQYTPLTYNKIYTYPLWAQVVSWGLALSSILWIPGYAVYILCNSDGPLSQKWMTVISVPSKLEKRIFRNYNERADSIDSRKLNDSLLPEKSGFNEMKLMSPGSA